MEYDTVHISHKTPKNRWKAIAYEATREIAKLKQSKAELLEALEALMLYVSTSENRCCADEQMEKAKQAIAKARENSDSKQDGRL